MGSLLRWVLAPLLSFDRIPNALKQLTSRIEEQQTSATQQSNRTWSTHVRSILLETLHESDWALRCAAAIALGRLGDTHVLPVLHQHILLEEDETVRSRIIESIGILSLQAPEKAGLYMLLDALEDPHWEVQQYALYALAQWPNQKDFIGERLYTALQEEPEWEVQSTLIYALGQLRYSVCQMDLIEEFHDNLDIDATMALELIFSIGRMYTSEVPTFLHQILKQNDPLLSTRALLALGHTHSKDPQTVDLLETYLQSSHLPSAMTARTAHARLDLLSWKTLDALGSSLEYWSQQLQEPSSEHILEWYTGLEDAVQISSSEERLLALSELNFMLSWFHRKTPEFWDRARKYGTMEPLHSIRMYLPSVESILKTLDYESLGALHWQHVQQAQKSVQRLQIEVRRDTLHTHHQQLEDALFD